MFLFLGHAGSAVKKQQNGPSRGEKKDLPVHQTSQASSGSLAAAIGRPNHRNYLEPRIQRQRTGKHKIHKMLQVRSELPLAIERICASNGTDGKTPTHVPTRYPVLPNPQIPKSKSSEGQRCQRQIYFSLATHFDSVFGYCQYCSRCFQP